MFRKLALSTLLAGLLIWVTGCKSVPMHMGAKPGSEYEIVGKAEGTGGGFMLFCFIPLDQNQRFMKAYKEAITRGGGDDLINPQLSEIWYLTPVGNGFLATVKGDVIRYKNPTTAPSVGASSSK